MMKRDRNDATGFTLVELLTVIAILATLTTLVFASIHSGKGRARSAVCKNNLRQLGLLLSSFVADHGEYPLFLNSDKQKYDAHESFWLRSIGAVAGLDPQGIGSSSTFFCPSAKKPNGGPPNLGYLDYGYNVSGILGAAGQLSLGLGGKGGEDAKNTLAPPVKEGDVTTPSDMIAIGDSFQASPAGLISDGDAQIGIYHWVAERFPGSHKRSLSRHAGIGNFVFSDGHILGIRLKGLLFDVADEHARQWNRDNKGHPERLGGTPAAP